MRRLSRISRILRSNGAVRGQQEVLGDLLSDRRSALHAPRTLQKHQAGADDALGVDAAVGIEILVLGGDEGVLDQRRNGRRGQIETPLARVFGQQAAVGGVNARHHRRLVVLQLGVVGQVLLELPDDGGDDRRRDDEDDGAGREHETEETGDAAHVSIRGPQGPDDDPPADRLRAIFARSLSRSERLVRNMRPSTDARAMMSVATAAKL